MRFPVILTIAAFLAPAGTAATPVHAAGFNTPAGVDQLFAAKKKKKKRAGVETNKEKYLKAAPGAGPSGSSAK